MLCAFWIDINAFGCNQYNLGQVKLSYVCISKELNASMIVFYFEV